jgi:hypothetical protein
MFNFLTRFLKSLKVQPRDAGPPRIWDSPRFAEELLSEPARRRHWTTLREDLWDLPPGEQAGLMDQLLIRFAAWVGDLPASERFHHARDYGLLDHSLEVAAHATRALSDRSFPGWEDAGASESDRRAWHYGAFVCGLLHDVGKVHDLEVRATPNADPWSPIVEPLAEYLARHGLTRTGPSLRHHLAGRGVAHQWRSPHLYLGLLPVEARRFLGRRFVLLLDAVEGVRSPARWISSEPAAQIVKAIHRADIESARSDDGRKRLNLAAARPGPSETEGGPAESSPSIPPLDLERVFTEFREALLGAVREGRIPLNQPKGLWVGSRFLYVDYGSGLECVLSLMEERGSGLQARHDQDAPLVRPELYMDVTPAGRVIEALRWKKALPMSSEERPWTARGVLETDRGVSLSLELVVLDRSLFPGEFPLMSGRVLLGEGAGDPDGEARVRPANPDAPSLSSVSPPRVSLPAPLPPEDGKGIRSIPESHPAPKESIPALGERAPFLGPSKDTPAPSVIPAGAREVPSGLERTLRDRRHQLFEDLKASLGNLLAHREEAAQEALRLHQEFRRMLPHSRLLLYAKRPKSPTPLRALYWGCHASSLKSRSTDGHGRKKGCIRHLSSELTESLIHRFHGDSQRALFLVFDRRRTALNEAMHALSMAIGLTFSRCYSLREVAGNREKPDWGLPRGASGGLPPGAESIAQQMWWLLSDILETESGLVGLGSEVEQSLGALGVRFQVEIPGDSRGRLVAFWVLPLENPRREWIRPDVVEALRLTGENGAAPPPTGGASTNVHESARPALGACPIAGGGGAPGHPEEPGGASKIAGGREGSFGTGMN